MPQDLETYRQALLDLYLRLVRQLWERQIPLTVAEMAFLLASARRAARNPDAIPLGPIRSLHYFLPVIADLVQVALRHSDTYLAYLRTEVALRPTPASNSSDSKT